MAIGLALLVTGVLSVIVGGTYSLVRVRRAYGAIDEYAVKHAPGTGAVPRLVSLAVLLGWLLVVVGAVATVIAVI